MVESVFEKSPQIPGYRVRHELGQGGMARVYMAIQESLEREVALKVLSTELVSDPEFCQRFLKEGKALARVTHPHVVAIFDSGEHQGIYYMCMELIRNGTLEDRIAQGGLKLDQSIHILKQVADALEWSHGKGLVHRDIKPGNVLFRDDRTAVLSDFGIAKSISKDTTRMTAVGLAIGTPAYMSPEQASGQELTAHSDQYSLGVMFYEMLTGKVPFQADTSISVALMHLQAPVPPLPEPYQHLQPVVERMMAKDTHARFSTFEEMTTALEKTCPGQVAVRGTEILKQPSRSLPGVRPRTLAIAGIFAALLAGGAYLVMDPPGFFTTVQPQPEPADPAKLAEISKWLEIAETHFDIGRLTEPPGNNALEAYWKVLDIDATNATAQQGLQKIADTYEKLAQESLDNGDLEETRTLVNEGLKAYPEHQGLTQLQEKLSNR